MAKMRPQILDGTAVSSAFRPGSIRLRKAPGHRRQAGFTLAEVAVSMGISVLVFAAIVTAYIQIDYRAEWSGYSLAAQALAIQQLEQARAAKWDNDDTPPTCELTNVPTTTTNMLDVPISGTNAIIVTNTATITLMPVAGGVGASVYMVRVDTVWPFRWKNTVRYYTNSLADYFAPD